MTLYERFDTLVHRFIGVDKRRPSIRPFTEKERSVIDQTLKSTGRALFASQGWKKTGIDDLCRAAGIARGTFYLFHPSKESFFITLLAEAEAAVKDDILATLTNPRLSGPETLAALIDLSLTVIERHPLLRFAFADPDEPAPWLRNLDSESIDVLVRTDDQTAARILDLLAQKGMTLTISPETFAGLLRALVLLPLSKRIIGPVVFDSVRRSLSAALSRGLT